jgi:hypothetical protein
MTCEGYIYIGFAEKTAMYTVEVDLFEGDLAGATKAHPVSGKLAFLEPGLRGLAFSQTPLWFSAKTDNMRYEIKLHEDGTCEIGRSWGY